MTLTQAALDDYRLPYWVAPRRYILQLVPDLEAATFSGTEQIEIEVLQATDQIVMNAKDLVITDASVSLGWANPPDSASPALALALRFDEAREQVSFVAPETLAPGRYRLSCRFLGTLNDKLHGFYRSRFLDADGVERSIATTQFEETDARLAFPCFDEPDRKAVFSVTLEAPPGMLAVSNGPELEVTTLESGATRTVFGDTIAMSTYLVAFIVGPLEATPAIDVDGIALRVIHVPGKGHLTSPCLEAAVHALGFYTEYFALPYPGAKLDLVGLPDFAAGAMENLGCVTFREAILLADPDSTSQVELQRLAEVVEHELAHMWFGDLVTMKWWNGIWLNEAFATFMALCCQDDYRPDWQCFVGFSRGKAAALGVDGLHSTRPVEFAVRHPDEAAAMFDVLTYQKGASVLWMLERYLGREAFRAGVRRYLAAHEYDNTETTDLWDAIELEAGETPIRALMDSWIFQGGYPLITATSLETGVHLQQQPFSYLPAETVKDESGIGSNWLVPLLGASVGEPSQQARLLLGPEPGRLELGSGPLVLNAGGAGFYRLRHDAILQSQLTEELFALQPIERYNFIADTWAVALSGLQDLEPFFAVAARITEETDPHVVSVVISAFGLLDLLAKEADRAALSSYLRQLLAPMLEGIGWERRAEEQESVLLLRSSLVNALGTLGADEAVIGKAHELFAADHFAKTPIDADLVAAVLAVTVAHADERDFAAILDRYRHPQSPMDEIRHLNCLANLTHPGLAQQVYELCRSEFRSQNAPFLLGSMLHSRPIAAQTWRFISSNFEELVQRFPDNSIHRMLSGVPGLALLDDDDHPILAGEVRQFCESHVEGARRRLVAQSLERLDVNVRFGQAVRAQLAGLVAAIS